MGFVHVALLRTDLMPFVTTFLTRLWPLARSGNSAEAARIVTGVTEDPPTSGPLQFVYQSKRQRQQQQQLQKMWYLLPDVYFS